MHDSVDAITRKDFIGRAGGLLAAVALRRPPVASRQRVRAVAFDGYAVFDATRTIAVAEAIVPGKGRELVTQWRARMFEYQWLRTLGARYVGFEQTASDALNYVLETGRISLGANAREELLEAQITLTPWPDAMSELLRIRSAGIRLALLSNMSETMLTRGLRSADLQGQFDTILSTDRVRAAKPDARAYAMGPSALKCSASEIAFVAFAPWDVAGASWFGYPTVWLNRANSPAEKLDASANVACKTLSEVATFVIDGSR